MGESDGNKMVEWVADVDGDLVSPSSGRSKRKSKPRKKEYVGWGSVQLIEFLESIGKMTTEALTQHDVSSIVLQYVTQNKLLHPEKKRRVICDEKLYALFQKKSIGKVKIYDLLEEHFAENQDDLDDSDMSSSDAEENVGSGSKQKKFPSSCGKALEKTKVYEAPKSCFAAVKPENIKLVYLRRSLVQNLLKDSEETFDRKVVGSFVRVKSDPLDYLAKNSHQLQLVKGVKKVTAAGSDVLLAISDMAKDVKISELSEDDFSEAECNDLSQKIKDGILKKLIVVDLQQKAELLHEDITKHRLMREIPRLQKLIDRANEQGRRREMYDYRETKKLLETPSEQARLLEEVPKVIAEELKMEDTSAVLVLEPKMEEEAADDRPIPMDSTETAHAVQQMDWVETKPAVASFEWVESSTPTVPSFDWVETKPDVPQLDWIEITPAAAHHVEDWSDGNTKRSVRKVGLNGSTPNGGLGNSTSTYLKVQEPVKEEVEENGVCHYKVETANGNSHPQPLSLTTPMSPEVAGSTTKKEQEIIDIDDVRSDPLQHSSQRVTTSPQEAASTKKKPEIITIDDDDEDDEAEAEAENTITSPHDQVWYYKDPQGTIQGPFPMALFKRWDELRFFPPGFRVWRAGQSLSESVMLSEVLLQMFSPPKLNI